jgi:hypothetical protein
MKHGIWIVVAVLAGLVLGSWGPSSDLRKAKEEIEDLKRRLSKGWSQGGEVDGVRQMLRIPGNDAVKRRVAERARKAPAVASVPVAAETTPEPAVAQAPAAATAATNEDANCEWDSEDIERATKFWNARASLARNSLVSNLKLDASQADRFDTVVSAMNLRLETGISNWVQRVKAKGDMTTEDGIRLMNELSTAVVVTYDEMDRSMPADWRKLAGEKFELINFVDPAVAMPLMEVDGLVGNYEKEQRRGNLHGEISIGVSQ